MFKINTDEKFFNRFKELESDLRNIASFFQNEGIEVPHDQWKEYIGMVSVFKQKFKELTDEGDKRFE